MTAAPKKELARSATFEDLKGKPKRTKQITLNITDADGDIVALTISMQAISQAEYDALMAKYPPTKDQKNDGAQYNPELFGPALISAVLTDPELTTKQVTEIWTNNAWSRGEVMQLFVSAIDVCSSGLDVPFTAPDSATTAPST